jgi:hypothetical protein
MILDKWLVGAISLCTLAGCSSSSDQAKTSGSPGTPSTSNTFDYVNQAVSLDSDLVIPSGKTVRVGSGVVFTASPNVKIQVEGTLIVEGTVASPSRFLGVETDAAPSNYWHGIEIESGGKIDFTYADVEGAEYGIHAMPGSTYKVDYGTFGTSFKPAVLESDGTFDHSTFHATIPSTVSLAEAVTIDDPNGTMTILDASPKVTNSLFEGSAVLTDMVRVGGNSVPVFDHDHFKGAHCAFHVFGATNNAPKVTNSIIENMSYGTMAFTSGMTFENSNFLNNTYDVGFCLGATASSGPNLTSDYFLKAKPTDPMADSTCFQYAKITSTLTAPVAGAGPVGL